MFSFFFSLSTYLVQITQNHKWEKNNNNKKTHTHTHTNTHTHTHAIRRNWNKLIINSVHHENIFYTSKYIQFSIELGKVDIWYSLMRDLMVFSRAFCFDLIIKGDKAARDACAEISPFFGLVGRTGYPNVIWDRSSIKSYQRFTNGSSCSFSWCSASRELSEESELVSLVSV